MSFLSRLLPEPGPVRVMSAATLVNMTGNGFYVACSLLFFTRVVGLGSQEVGIGLTIAVLIGVVSGVPIGRLSDRFGIRDVFIILQLVQGAAMLLFPLAHGFASFMAVTVVATVGQRAGMAVGAALIAQIAPEGKATRTRTYLRSVTNLGVSIGLAVSGLALQADSRAGYTMLITANGLTFLVAGVMLLRLPRLPGSVPAGPGGRVNALRDRPYLAIAALSGLLAIQYDVWSLVLPIWVVQYTEAPRWLISPLLISNTVLIILFQVRAGRRIDGARTGAAAVRRSGLAFLVGTAALALTHDVSAWLAVLLLSVGVLAATVAELFYVAGSFELSYAFAPDGAHGQYQGAFSLVGGLIRAASPALLTWLCLGLGRPGWIVLGVGLAGAGLLAPLAALWAERTRVRPMEPVPEPG